MAGLNVAEWTPDQVAEWLSGLGPSVAQYVPGLRARGLAGGKLLTLRCDDLEYLGVDVIGHQELILEAVEHLRNFQYELSRECIQQLALRVSVAGTSIVRSLRHQARQEGGRLDTQLLADVARAVLAVKPLVCWLDATAPDGDLAARRTQLLQLALEAATCAMRDRFADHPARAVAAAAAGTGAAAASIVREARDPRVLAPAALHAVSLRVRRADLGFEVRRSHCGHLQLASVRFGSPAHASGQVHVNDEIVQVGSQCVIGWGAVEVERACLAAGARGELALRLRRRAARPPPALARRRGRGASPRTLLAPPAPDPDPDPDPEPTSDSSEPLSPPASPTSPTAPHHTRMYPLKPRATVSRRHSVSGGSPAARRHSHTIDQFWQQLKERVRGAAAGSAGGSPEPDDVTLYARDKAVSYSTGLELHPRPRTCPGPARGPPAAPAAAPAPAPTSTPSPAPAPAPATPDERRGKLDKAHSTPAYDLGVGGGEGAMSIQAQPIPESPTTPLDSPTVVVHSAAKADQILAFKKCSSVIGEAMQHRRDPALPAHPAHPNPIEDGTVCVGRDVATTEKVLETINIAMLEHRRRSLLAASDASDGGKRDSATPATPATPADPPPRYSYLRSTPRARPSSPPTPPTPPPRPPVPAALPVLRAVPRKHDREPVSPMKPTRPIDATQISVPLRTITKHDIRVIPAERRELPAMNAEPARPAPRAHPPAADVAAAAGRGIALSPTSAVRGIFPSSKSRSLKKKSSILAKRRCVPYKVVVGSGTAASGVWQRVRARAGAAPPRWARRTLLLTHNLLYAYKSPECGRAACMVYLEGYTAAAAGEVKSRAHAFKVYHTGVAFYFACDSRDAMLAWIQLIHRATLLPSLLSHVDVSRQFSETDYSETESDTESADRRSERDRDRDNKERDKDKSKFGSLKKLTGRMQRSESQENVSHSSTSLDRKYLGRFFSRHKSKDDTKPKNKQSPVPVPTEHYRSYRRVPPPAAAAPPLLGALGVELRASKKIPNPIHYIHASNPNLLDFEKSDFVTKPALQVPTKPKLSKPESLAGLVTLEQFMLQKQEEERRQLYSNRVLRAVDRDRDRDALQQRDALVPDVIYGEVHPPDIPVPVLELQAATAPAPSTACYKERRPEPGCGKPISVKGKDGYEKIVYTDDPPEVWSGAAEACLPPGGGGGGGGGGGVRERRPAPPAPERWRDSLRRNDKVHSAREGGGTGAGAGGGGGGGGGAGAGKPPPHDTWSSPVGTREGGAGSGAPPGGVSRLRLMFTHAQPPLPAPPAPAPAPAQYPHLQCPPTFHPESYSLAEHPRRRHHHHAGDT